MDNNDQQYYDDSWEQFIVQMEELFDGKEDYENQSTKGDGDEYQSSNERSENDSRQPVPTHTNLSKL